MSWTCKACGMLNWSSRSTCRGCPPAPGGKSQQAGKGRMGRGKGREPSNSSRSPSAESPSSTHFPPTENTPGSGTESCDRATLQTQLSAVESAMEALGDTAAPDITQGLQAKAEKLKQQLMASRPLGQRLEGLRGAIQRGETRLLKAQAALEEATKKVDEETQLLTQRREEMRRLEAELVRDLASPPSGFRHEQQGNTVPPWVAERLEYFAQQLRAGNLTNPAALADQLLLLGEPAVSDGASRYDETETPYHVEQLDGHTEADMECAGQQIVQQWSEAPGNRRRLLGKHLIETPQLGAPGSTASSTPSARA